MVYKIGTVFLVISAIALVFFCGAMSWFLADRVKWFYHEISPVAGIAAGSLLVCAIGTAVASVLLHPDFRD